MVSFYVIQFLINDNVFVSLYYKIKINSDFSGEIKKQQQKNTVFSAHNNQTPTSSVDVKKFQ